MALGWQKFSLSVFFPLAQQMGIRPLINKELINFLINIELINFLINKEQTSYKNTKSLKENYKQN